jgi:hypothetical protein
MAKVEHVSTWLGTDTVLTFTAAEQRTLRRAAAIADQARAALRADLGEFAAEELDIDTELAGIAIGVELALDDDGGYLIDYARVTS